MKVLRSPFLNPRDQVNPHDNSTIIFTGANENLTQFAKVLLVKVSEILNLSKFVRLFHRQSFALYGIAQERARVISRYCPGMRAISM